MILYARLAGIVAFIALLVGVGWWLGSRSWQTKYEALQAAGFQQQAEASDARANALASQLKSVQTILESNQEAMNEYQARTVSAESDAALARSLLAAASIPAPRRRPLSEAGGGQPIAPARPESRGVTLESTLTAAIGECEHNANQLDALIAEIKPQL